MSPNSGKDANETTTAANKSGGGVVVVAAGNGFLERLGFDVQVKLFSYLRAHDLSAVHRTNRHFWQAKRLQHAIVVYCAEQVYPPQWTQGFELQPTSQSVEQKLPAARSTAPPITARRDKTRSSSLGSQEDDTTATTTVAMRGTKHRSSSVGSDSDNGSVMAQTPPVYYTFEHLRNMELLVVARVLNSPEPTTGYVVSKHWCKAALAWLEGQQQQRVVPEAATKNNGKKGGGNGNKKSKKKNRQEAKKNKKVLNHPPPPPNINSDITCEHEQLQHTTSTRSARARRRLLDKNAWRCLKALYPQSTTLPTWTGECMQCRLEAVQAQKARADAEESAKQRRMAPLQDPITRRFYTRTRGVPDHCLRDSERTMMGECPLIDGTYYVLPRSWCHGWRRFMKTGEGGKSETMYEAPDSARVLCDLHRMALLPPHLKDFLYGKSSQLLESSTHRQASTAAAAFAQMPDSALPALPAVAEESVQAMRSLGLNEDEIARQLAAMRSIEAQRRRIQEAIAVDTASSPSRNEMLDRENYIVVEILTREEFLRLEKSGSFGLQFRVASGQVYFDTPICRCCDTSGRQGVLIRPRGSTKKGNEKARTSASLEY